MRLIYRLLNHTNSLLLFYRLPLLRQRQTSFVPGLGRRHHMLRHQPTRDSGQRFKEGKHQYLIKQNLGLVLFNVSTTFI